MKIFDKVNDFVKFRNSEFFVNKTVGFVPTMGALHEGHLSLIKESVKNNDITIVSVFVNPRQFNDISDYNNYPVNINDDMEKLMSVHCDVLFMPSNDDIYEGYRGYVMDFKGMDRIYEGEFRPGHFQGVVDIVYRLFTLVKPDNAYFGEKDFQQLAIIKLMVKQSGLKINIVPCPIIREESGLAMSSRNERLDPECRKRASRIYEVISKYSEDKKITDDPDIIISKITAEINEEDCLKTEYVIFCDPESLDTIEKFTGGANIQLCLAVWCKKVRLIDNISLQF